MRGEVSLDGLSVSYTYSFTFTYAMVNVESYVLGARKVLPLRSCPARGLSLGDFEPGKSRSRRVGVP